MFNGAGSYNFGLIAYGLPGCGKTTLIKVIANMLGRKVMIVNMSKITKTSDFKKLFYGPIGNDFTFYKKYIYVLE